MHISEHDLYVNYMDKGFGTPAYSLLHYFCQSNSL